MARDSPKQKTRGEKISKKSAGQHLSLDLIEALGGTKDDLRLLEDIDEIEDAEDLDLAANDFDAEPIKKDEIRNFMQELGIFDHRPDTGKEEKKPRKLLKAPVADDDSDDDDENGPDSQTAPQAPDPSQSGESKKKKKEKNKFKSGDTDPELGQAAAPQKEPVRAAAEPSEAGTKKKKKKERNKFKVQHDEVSSTTSGEEELASHLKTHPQRPYLLMKPGDAWMDDQAHSGAEGVTKALMQQCEQFAAKLLEDEVALYKTQRERTKKGDSNWIKKVLISGTLSDKMAALTLLVQESPAHNLTALDTLVTMAKKKGKREAMLAADTLKNLFVSDTSPLPDHRKLIAFDTRPVASLWRVCSGNRDSVDRRLVSWYAEDQLRQKYSAFVKALDVMSYDTLSAAKEKALAVIHSLLVSKPEQENVLLPMLVNKLGDPDHKIASKASYLLLRLVEQHPNMKSIIATEVERLVYRPNVAQRAQYYAICFLNQIKLHKADHALASQLIGIFFTFFKVYVKKGEVDSKMMAALLTGVNRAYPFAKVKQDFLLEQMATLYKIVHIVNFNTSVQALMLLHQVVDPSKSESDRYFMALYRKLLDPALRSSAKQPQFLNLLYKSMKDDIMDKRVKAFLKRLLQAGSLLGPNFLCGALIVISEVLKQRPNLLTVKQLGQKSTLEWNGNKPRASIADKPTGDDADHNKAGDDDDDDDEEERFVDLPLPAEFQDEDADDRVQAVTTDADAAADTDGVVAAGEAKAGRSTNPQSGVSSWVHRQNLKGKSEQHGYDCYQRNPLYCRAQDECLWELQALTRHYHPTVSLYAGTILQGQFIEYSGDPLQDFTLIRFLDRFVYKNPKKKEAGETRSETVGAASGKKEQSWESVPVNSAKFIEGGEEAVPEHERYLYRYFSQRAEKKKREEEEDSDAGSVSDSEFDAFLEKYERQMDHDNLDGVDFGLDFAGDMGKKGGKGKKQFDDGSDEDMDEDEDDDGGLSDEEVDFGDDEDDDLAAEFRREMEGLGKEEDNDDEDGDEDEDFSGDELKEMMSASRKRSKKPDAEVDALQGRPPKKSRRSGLDSMFAAADDFADVLEGNADTASAAVGTLDDVRNTDKASAKQIAWEAERDRQTRGRDWKQSKQRRKAGHKGGKPFKKGRHSGTATHRGHGGKRRK